MDTPRTATLAALLLAAAGCVAGEGDELIDSETAAIDDDPGGGCWPDCFDPPGSGTTVTGISLSGREVFDDWRTFGRFALRKDLSGNTGKHHSMDGSTTNANYLGLRDATVSVYEVDKSYAGTESDCHDLWNVGSATVADDGTWSISLGSLTDACTSDDDPTGKVKLAVKVRLRYCDSVRCFSVVEPAPGTTTSADMSKWSLYESGASWSSPWTAGNGSSMSFGTHYFRDTSTLHDEDTREEAAWIFSALVDETRKFHVQNSWPFAYSQFGEVFAQYPSPNSGNARDGTIQIEDDTLKGGWVPLHEYGHIVAQRITTAPVGSQGNDLLPCGNDFSLPTSDSGYVRDTATECDSWSRDGELEFDEKAWSEGFADFAAHMTLDTVDSTETPYPVGCSQSAFDINDSANGPVSNGITDGANRRRIFGCGTSPGTCSQGDQYPTNIARALCDWYDAGDDDDPQRGGAGDYKSHSLDQMYNTMNGAYDWVDQANLAVNGFTICDFVEYHLVGAPVTEYTSHRDLFQNNGFSCGL